MPSDLPAGVTLRDISGTQPEPPELEYCDQDDDAAKRRADWMVRDRSGRHLDHPAYTEEQAYALVRHFTEHDPESRCYVMPDNEDAQSLLRIKADTANFNAAVTDFDALTNYRFDRIDPADIATYLRVSWGERNTFYITFYALAKRLGY